MNAPVTRVVAALVAPVVAPSAGSLTRLHDFYQPAPPAWMPQTIGWYAVFALAVLVVLGLGIRYTRLRFINRYRRTALRELALVHTDELSALLKRTALAAWPREKVASLNGESWLAFLNASAPVKLFASAPSNAIEELTLRPAPISGEDERELRRVAGEWIRRHRVQA